MTPRLATTAPGGGAPLGGAALGASGASGASGALGALPPEPPKDLDAMLKRLALPTIRRLHAEPAVRAEADGMSYHTYLETLVAEEIAHRAETRLRRAVRGALFPALRTIDDFNFTFQSALRRQMLGSFLGVELVTEGRNAIFTPPTAAQAARGRPTSSPPSPTARCSTATKRASPRRTC